MTLALVGFLMFIGVALIFLEVFVIPGTTVFGIAGGVAVVLSVYFSYTLLGTNYGHLTLSLGFILFLIFFFLGKRLMKNNNLSLDKELKGKVNVFESEVSIGDTGVCHADIRPNGKAIINDKKVEVYSVGSYIEKGTKIKVVDIQQNKIIVKAFE